MGNDGESWGRMSEDVGEQMRDGAWGKKGREIKGGV